MRNVKKTDTFLISNFRRVLNVVCFLLDNSSPSELYMPTFRNTLFHLHMQVVTYLPMKMEQTECSETSAYKIQTPGDHPEESVQQAYVSLYTLHCGKLTKQYILCRRQLTFLYIYSFCRPVLWVPGLSRCKERRGRDADPSPSSSAVVMKG